MRLRGIIVQNFNFVILQMEHPVIYKVLKQGRIYSIFHFFAW